VASARAETNVAFRQVSWLERVHSGPAGGVPCRRSSSTTGSGVEKRSDFGHARGAHRFRCDCGDVGFRSKAPLVRARLPAPTETTLPHAGMTWQRPRRRLLVDRTRRQPRTSVALSRIHLLDDALALVAGSPPTGDTITTPYWPAAGGRCAAPSPRDERTRRGSARGCRRRRGSADQPHAPAA